MYGVVQNVETLITLHICTVHKINLRLICLWHVRSRAAKIENFITTLSDLHKQFQWPFPAVSANEISRIGGASFYAVLCF